MKKHMKDMLRIYFGQLKIKVKYLDKLKARDFNATSLSTHDSSTLYSTLPHYLIKDKLINLIESSFQREGSPYKLHVTDRNAFSLRNSLKISCMVLSKCM